MQWSIEQIDVLISQVESRESIWNVLSLDYKDRVKKSNDWKEVAQILQKEQAEVSLWIAEGSVYGKSNNTTNWNRSGHLYHHFNKNEHCTELNEHMVIEVIVNCVMVR